MPKEFEIESVLIGWNHDGEIELLDFGSTQDVEAEFTRTLAQGDECFTHFAVGRVVKVAAPRESIREFPDRIPQEQDQGNSANKAGSTEIDGGGFEERPDCSGWS